PEISRHSPSMNAGQTVIISFAKNGRENQMQFLCFAIEIEGLLGKVRLGSSDQAEKISSLFRFFNATADRAAELLFGHALVCFAVICANACAAFNQLVNQSIVGGVVRHCF